MDTAVRDYRVPWLATVLHRLPHLDITFQTVNSTFNLTSTPYKESLLFWAAMPVMWLLATLLTFLIYFCYRCCQRDVEKRRRIPCVRWSMAISALLCCGAIGLGFYGNEETNKGIAYLTTSARDATDTVNRVKNQVQVLQRSFNETVNKGIDGIKKIYQAHELNRTVHLEVITYTEQAFYDARNIGLSAREINRKSKKVDLSEVILYSNEYGLYRWLGMLLVFGWLVLLCLLLLFGIGKSSKCTLLLFCAFGIFSLVICWMSAGIHLAVAVGVSDLCVAPHNFTERILSEHVDKDIVSYYIRCERDDTGRTTTSPFKEVLQNEVKNLKIVNDSLNKALDMAYKFIPKSEFFTSVQRVYAGLDEASEALLSLRALTLCTNIHRDYINALQGVCQMALPGVVYILLSNTITGLFLSFLVVLASRAWRNFGSSRKQYMEADEEDGAFLPHPGGSSSPSYYRYGQGSSRPTSIHDDSAAFNCGGRGGRSSATREQISLQRRTTPPPAYNSNEFYLHYHDSDVQG